jgi:hydroxymethylbilane synthase
MIEKVRIATRGSKLALWQAEFIAHCLTSHYGSEVETELKVIKTSGDRILDVPLAQLGGKGLFVKEIEEALLAKEADLAVHSMKDMPAELPEGLHLGVFPERDDCTDSLLSCSFSSLWDLPVGARVGTSSLRRKSQIAVLRPDVNIEPLRGNLDTRIRKLEEGQFDAIVVASVGLKRLGLSTPAMHPLKPPDFLPAIGQGALGIEYRQDDDRIDSLLQFIDHNQTRSVIKAERSFLATLEGGCQVPMGGLAQITEDNSTLVFQGFVADIEGRTMIKESAEGSVDAAERIGASVAVQILDRGGRQVLQDLYH